MGKKVYISLKIVFIAGAHQLVLVRRNSCELCLRKDESPIFLLLDILHGPSLPLPPLHQVDAGLELVHRVQDHLQFHIQQGKP